MEHNILDNMAKRYMRLSDVMPPSKGGQRFDSMAERRKQSDDARTDTDLLRRMETAWDNDDTVRQEGERCHRFVYGDQWGDLTFYDGRWMTERAYLISRGKVPLTNNVTRRLITAVKGNYIGQKSEPKCVPFSSESSDGAQMLSRALTTNWRRNYNSMSMQLNNALENFLIRGIAVMGESYERTPSGKFDARTKLYDPRKVAIESSMNDPLMDDISLIGIIHDARPVDFLSKFGTRISRKVLDAVKEEYGDMTYRYMRDAEIDNSDRNSLDYLDFHTSHDPSLWRFYEVWTKEIKTMWLCYDPARLNDPFKVDDIDGFRLDEYGGLTVKEENERRRMEAISFGIPEDDVPYIDYGQFGDGGMFQGTGEFTDVYWYVKFLTPRGTVIDEYVSPYDCGCPITVVKYPYVNGEVHSYINDVIPQQKYINRLVTLNDVAIRSTAKGALLVDKRSLEENDDQTMEEIRQQWGDPDGVVFYDSQLGGQPPRQVCNTSTNVGIDTALSMQLGLMEDISGVHGAAQGKDALSGQSGSLYAQQAQNSNTMLRSVLEAFGEFTKMVAVKKLSIINQFWEDGRVINTYGGSRGDVARFDRSLLEDLEYEVTIINSDDVENATAVSNQLAWEIFRTGAINAKNLLEVGTWPASFKERALKVIEEQEAAMQAQQQMEQQAQQQQMDERQLEALQQQLPQQQARQIGNDLYNGSKMIG